MGRDWRALGLPCQALEMRRQKRLSIRSYENHRFCKFIRCKNGRCGRGRTTTEASNCDLSQSQQSRPPIQQKAPPRTAGLSFRFWANLGAGPLEGYRGRCDSATAGASGIRDWLAAWDCSRLGRDQHSVFTTPRALSSSDAVRSGHCPQAVRLFLPLDEAGRVSCIAS